MTNAGIKAVLKKAMIESEQISTAWMGFYLNVYLYLVLVTSLLNIPTALAGLYSIPLWVGEGNVLDLVWFFLTVLAGVAAIFTFIELRDFTLAGYKWNIVLLCAGFAENALSTYSRWQQEHAHLPGGLKIEFLIGAQVAGVLIWLIPNLIYFKKRRHLFRTYTTSEVAAAIKGEPPASALPIRMPCHYKPTKAKVDIQKLLSFQAEGNATRLARIMKDHKQIQA